MIGSVCTPIDPFYRQTIDKFNFDQISVLDTVKIIQIMNESKYVLSHSPLWQRFYLLSLEPSRHFESPDTVSTKCSLWGKKVTWERSWGIKLNRSPLKNPGFTDLRTASNHFLIGQRSNQRGRETSYEQYPDVLLFPENHLSTAIHFFCLKIVEIKFFHPVC